MASSLCQSEARIFVRCQKNEVNGGYLQLQYVLKTLLTKLSKACRSDIQ